MITNVFYIMVIFCLIIEFITLFNMKEITYGLSRYSKLNKEYNGHIPRDKIGSGFILHQVCNIFYFVICIIGIISSQWICFLAIIIQSISIGRFRRKHIIIRYFDSILSILILLFALINKYHLHINLLNEILKIN